MEPLMGLIKKMRRHAAMASGNFNSMFKGVEIPRQMMTQKTFHRR